MADPRIPLRDPWFALVLAFVLPGLGHLYQRRYLKSAIFFVTVMGLFCWGMGTAEGKAVYYKPIWGKMAGQRKEGIGFIAQAGIGLPALPAIYQHRRYYDISNQGRNAELEPLTATFTGEVSVDLEGEVLEGPVAGELKLEPQRNEFEEVVLAGTFEGVTDDGREVAFDVGRRTSVGLRIDADPRRGLETSVLDKDGRDIGRLVGFVPRPFWNYLEVPLSEPIEIDINNRLGTQFELAYVLAMIAGMLNLLVAYDAFEGPAYGYDVVDPAKGAKSD